MAISSLLLLNTKGEVLLWRRYRGDVSRAEADFFRTKVVASKEFRCPITKLGSCTFFHIREQNVFFVAVTRSNANTAAVFEYMQQMLHTFKQFMGGKINEEAIRSNFVLLYELMDESIDFGYPQNTAGDILQLAVTQTSKKNTQPEDVTVQATGQVSWRPLGIKHRKNQIWMDFIEKVNMVMSVDGEVLSCDIHGSVQVKSQLSGMPECKLGLNDKLVVGSRQQAVGNISTKSVSIEDWTFAQCVRLSDLELERTVNFIPPDGEFELMSYRVSEVMKPPFIAKIVVNEISSTRLDIMVVVRSTFGAHQHANNFVMLIPVPDNTAKVTTSVSTGGGRASYVPEEGGIAWKLRRFSGKREFILTCNVEMLRTVDSVSTRWVRPPACINFSIPMLAASGLKVQFLKVIDSSQYEAIRWVRYITQAENSYAIRMM
ncbi:hypothetical protein RCL1_000710 [Eukaryota sp. TZLM3-RCL]